MAELQILPKMLPYIGLLETRGLTDIDRLVVHCTELPDLESARDYGERIHYADSGTGNSGHFYIDRNGAIEQWVPENRIAHHARNFNATSLGVELVNSGRYPDWFDSRNQDMKEPYPDEQIEALVMLLRWLSIQLPSLTLISGHEDLDPSEIPASDDKKIMVRRKRDPGPLFPWNFVLERCSLQRAPLDGAP